MNNLKPAFAILFPLVMVGIAIGLYFMMNDILEVVRP